MNLFISDLAVSGHSVFLNIIELLNLYYRQTVEKRVRI